MSVLVLCTMMEGNSVLISTACQTKYLFYISLRKYRLKNQGVFISSILATIKKSKNNFIFCFLYSIRSCKTLLENWTVLLFWGADQFNTLNDFLNIENVKILPYQVHKYQNNSFLGQFRLLYGYNLLYRFTRYGLCDFFAPPRLSPGCFRLTVHDPKYGTCFFWLS